MSKRVDKTFASRYSGRIRASLHRVYRALTAKRNGVVGHCLAAPTGKGLRVHAVNTNYVDVTVSRTIMIGPLGGLFQIRKGKRGYSKRYLKASQIGKGSM